MSSQPPPPTPIHPRSTLSQTPSMTEARSQHQFGPLALPPPPFIGSPYNSTPGLNSPVRLAPISIPPQYKTGPGHILQHSAPPRFPHCSGASNYERRPPGPVERPLTSPWSTVPRADSLHSRLPYTGTSPQTDPGFAVRTLGGAEHYNQSKAPVQEIRQHAATYPAPGYTVQHVTKVPQRRTIPPPALVAPPVAQPVLAAPEHAHNDSSSSRYEISLRQQPLAARACGFGERDRRVIDPPPIVQLSVKDNQSEKADVTELRYPFNVVHCTLWNENGSLDETALSSQDRRVTRRLMGTLVSSPFVGLDENDKEGCFFCFPDLSCRTNGKYRLRFVLMRIEVNDIQNGGFSPIIAETVSDVFTVFTAKDFPGMRASTPLTKALKRQGCAISVKKGNEKANVRARDDDSGDDEDDENGSGQPKRRRRA